MVEVTLHQAISWIIFVVLGVAGVGGYFFWRHTKAQEKARIGNKGDAEKLLLDDQRRILDLKVGDIVDYYLDSLEVESVLIYDEEGYVWKTYLLSGADDGRDRWLSVDDDDRLEIALYEKLPAGAVEVPEDPPRQLTVGAVTFQLDEKGAARVRKQDVKGTRDQGNCRYADYEGPDEARLSVEWWGRGEVEVSLGKPVREDELLILPGS